MEPIKNRYEFTVIFDVENGNPNGDPEWFRDENLQQPFSPHTRGMIPTTPGSSSLPTAFPRIRGGDPVPQ